MSTWARQRPECCATRWSAHADVSVDLGLSFRGIGARPGGWVGRGPAFTGGIGRVTASFTGRSISSP